MAEACSSDPRRVMRGRARVGGRGRSFHHDNRQPVTISLDEFGAVEVGVLPCAIRLRLEIGGPQDAGGVGPELEFNSIGRNFVGCDHRFTLQKSATFPQRGIREAHPSSWPSPWRFDCYRSQSQAKVLRSEGQPNSSFACSSASHSLLVCDRFVGCKENVGLAGILLALHALDDPIPEIGTHATFERVNNEIAPIKQPDLCCPFRPIGRPLSCPLERLDYDRLFSKLAHVIRPQITTATNACRGDQASEVVWPKIRP